MNSRHIIGGDITYECLGEGNSPDTRNFEITMKIYRDCAGGGAEFDNPAEIGIYRKTPSGLYTFIETIFVNFTERDPIGSEPNPCFIITRPVCAEQAVYTFNLNNLPVLTEDSYFLTYARCCRNNTINNIENARNTGATYTVEITSAAQSVCNSSPVFNDFPPTIICANEALNFDHSAFDPDTSGSQLVYEFCAPLQGGGPQGTTDNPGDDRACNGIRPDPSRCPPPRPTVVFRAPDYTPGNPMAGNPVVAINPITGIITGTPEITGQFVVGVCVSEFDNNGVLLSVLRRDFQFNVTQCEPTVLASIESDAIIGEREFVVNGCGVETIDFINESTDEAFIQNYLWEFDINGQFETRSTRDATITFPGVGTYQGKMVLNRGTECADSAEINVNIFPSIVADFEFDYDTCVAGPVSFESLSQTGAASGITGYTWDFMDGAFSSLQDPNHLFNAPGLLPVELLVEDGNGCKDSITKEVSYFPVPPLLIIEPSTFDGCVPAEIFFNNLSTPIDSTYDIVWRFGDGGTGEDVSPTYTYENPGVYDVSLEVTSPIGCFTQANFPALIRIAESPEAAFTFSPTEVNSTNSTVFFNDQSIDAVSWQWNFNNEVIVFEQNPNYTFQDTGIKVVELVVRHPSGCPDTARAIIDVVPIASYHLPNAFSPNNDGTNDIYRGVGILTGITEFEMSIWNRWGEQIFMTNDPNEG
ncbi:MAG: PKD domain-containing protein, partial [Bacteroidota bacterium]